MNKDQETQRRVEARLREAAPPIPQDTHSVWPAVQERLRPRACVRPLLWAGMVATACAALCAAWMTGHSPQTALIAPIVTPAPMQVTTEPPMRVHRHIHHIPRLHKETIAARTARPHPSHIAYRKSVETPMPAQTPLPDKDAETPRLRPASSTPRPVPVKPVE